MRTCFSFFRMRFRTLLQYRASALAGVATQIVFGLVRVMIMLAFYSAADAAQPMSCSQTVTYIWIGQATLGLLPWNTEKEITNSVVTGQVAYELTRPVDLYAMWFARTLAFRTAPTLMKAVPQFVLNLFFPKIIRMTLPSPAAAAAWLLTTFMAAVLSAAITNLMQAMILTLTRGEGIVRLIQPLSELFTGLIIPLALMPDFLSRVLVLQPFAGVADLPARLFCGVMPPEDVWQVLALQIFWIAVFILAGRKVMARGLKKLTVAGG